VSKAIQGIAMLGAAVADGVAMFAMASTGVGVAALPFMMHAMEALVVGGLTMEAAAVASALQGNRGTGLTARQPAANRQIIRGMRRCGGVEIFRSTTGGSKRQLNYVIVLAGHVCWAITGLYLDGRLVYFEEGSGGNTTQNGYNFGGSANGNTYTGPNGVQYNFGSLVYCEARYGTQASGDVITGLTANDPTWAATEAGSPYVGGNTYVYLKVEGDSSMFPDEPEIKFTVMGKPIYDPRTGETAYSDNWALHVADHLSDTVFGVGDPYVNEEQLVAAANICDEQIAFAGGGGGTEAQFTLHWNYDTSMSPGNALVTMMEGAQGRVRQIGGEWYVFPAAWIGPSFSFDHGMLAGGIEWNPTAGVDALCNTVTGTYIAPNYPYSVAGNLYDTNGYYDGEIQNNWPFAYQPTNFPQYARDPAHGYASAEDLNLDSGVIGAWSATQTYNEGDVVTFGTTIYVSLIDGNLNVEPSVADGGAEPASWALGSLYLPKAFRSRVGRSVTQPHLPPKIALMRTRFMGKGKLPMMLPAYAMQSLDVMEFTSPELGWTAKVLEVDQPVMRAVETRLPNGDEGAPALQVMVPVSETDPSIYEWEISEEQTVYAAQALPQSASGAVAPPTDLTLVSSAATALVQPDGSILPRIQVNWATPEDELATKIPIQYRLTPEGGTTPPWIDAGIADVSLNSFFTGPLVAGQSYDVRIAAERPNGAMSVWVELDGFVASLLYSTLSASQSIGQSSLIAEAYTDGTAAILCNPFTAQIGSRAVSYFPAGTVTLTGLVQQQMYYVWVQDPSAAGGNLTPVATTTNEYAGQLGWWLIGTVVTPYSTTGSTGLYYPTVATDSGTRTTSNPDAAFDGDLSTFATTGGACGGSNATYGALNLSGFPPIASPSPSTLTIIASAAVSGVGGTCLCTVSINGAAPTNVFSLSADTAQTTYTFTVPANTPLSQLTVRIEADPDVTGSGTPPDLEYHAASASIQTYEVNVQF
jgi:hypothetical protein